jgi:uncharacterized protein (DUF1330 family)
MSGLSPLREGDVAAYVVLFRESTIKDASEMAKYRELGSKNNSSQYGLKPLAVYGAQVPLEGRPPDGVVILEFPDVDTARAWYTSEGYQAAVKHRLAAADYRGVIVEGFSGVIPK